MSADEQDKPMIIGPIEEFKEPSVQRMSEYGDYHNNATAYSPLQCSYCLCYYPALYLVGDVCRFCDMAR